MVNPMSKGRRVEAQRQIDAWNGRYEVGTRVAVRRDDGETTLTTTTTDAQMLSGETAVIWLADISGCYALECVSALAGQGGE